MTWLTFNPQFILNINIKPLRLNSSKHNLLFAVFDEVMIIFDAQKFYATKL